MDVLAHLEDLRRIEWDTAKETNTIAITPNTPPDAFSPSGFTPVTQGGMTTSYSQPIYVPGKYSVTLLFKTVRHKMLPIDLEEDHINLSPFMLNIVFQLTILMSYLGFKSAT